MSKEGFRGPRQVGGDTRFEGNGIGSQMQLGRYENGNQVLVVHLQVGPMAPCMDGGQVTTVDYDSREGVCVCPFRTCPVGANNVVLTEPILTRTDTNS